ncbi:hypothetical protein ANO14919_072090 [Xylariales sp. No.14919]|nr:hypothetical protein ANO14919_072090 [Xylariales sp. No.14919]
MDMVVMGVLTLLSLVPESIIRLFTRRRTAKPLPEASGSGVGESECEFAYEMQPSHYSKLGDPYQPRLRTPPEYRRGEGQDFCLVGWTEKRLSRESN